MNTKPQQDIIPFGPQNSFIITLGSLDAIQSGGIRLPVYADLHAIRRNPLGDVFNCLDTLARDSSLILGQAYAPPGTFTALEFTFSPYPFVIVFYEYFTNTINVVVLPQIGAFHRLPASGQALSIKVEENRLTRVTVTFDLDSSLVRRTETYEYRPKFYVSSVQNF